MQLSDFHPKGVIPSGAAFPAEREISGAKHQSGSSTDQSVILDTSGILGPCQNNFVPSDDHPDFDALTRQHKDAVYRQMLRVCGNREDAEDVLIEALLKAYRHLNQLRDSSAFRAWLAQIARRVCWQLKEREALLPLLQLSTLDEEGRELPAGDPTPEASLARRQLKQLLDDATAALPELYRAVYEMRDIEDLPGDEVARKLGISRAAMKSRLHRARDLVRAHLDAALTRADQAVRSAGSPGSMRYAPQAAKE
jgi:RNA polymerase sigma-70 factor (ECF subfamily)